MYILLHSAKTRVWVVHPSNNFLIFAHPYLCLTYSLCNTRLTEGLFSLPLNIMTNVENAFIDELEISVQHI